MPRRFRALAFWLVVLPALAQLPPSGKLSDSDRPLFRAEVARVEKLLNSAPDRATVTYEMARTWASAKQWPEALQWLRKAIGLNAGLDPSRDSVFAALGGTREFDAIMSSIGETTPAVSHSVMAFKVPEGDLVPESMAWDPAGRQFYFGSMTKGKVVRCSRTGTCMQFAGGLGTVLGLKVHGNGLWVLSNSDKEAGLIHYDLASARVLRRYTVAGAGHNFNDLAIASSGDVYLTDTRAGAVWRLAKGADELTKLPQRFEFANGITLSDDGNLLYVSTFPDGLTILNLNSAQAAERGSKAVRNSSSAVASSETVVLGLVKSQSAMPIGRPADLCLAMIDGLYFYRGSLIAIQNGFMNPRVVRLRLSHDLRAIEQFEVLERRNAMFEGITTGVLVGSELFYMANIQDDKKADFNPITVLRLPL